MPWPPNDPDNYILDKINFVITLTGNGKTEKLETIGEETIRATASVGLWNINVKAYYPDKNTLYAEGNDSVNVKAGQNNSVIVTMQRAFKLIEMVRIPAGTFTMGSPTTEPGRDTNETQHQVTLTQGFYMSIYTVTQAQYVAVMNTNPSSFTGNPNHPVEMVSWYDALVFCNTLSLMEGLTPAYSISGSTNPDDWGTVPTANDATWNSATIVTGSTGYRLPTEAQWEYACRAGTTTAYNTGDTITDDTVWHSGNSNSSTQSVGQKPANVWGLYDMHGNVFEWCWDRFSEDYYTDPIAETDPAGPSTGDDRVIRGGSWNGDAYMRSAYRTYNFPWLGVNNTGFRVVRP